MNFHTYQIAANRTANAHKYSVLTNLVHAQIGLATETGEFATEVKRMFSYGTPLTPAMELHMFEELGDILWYVALACTALQVTMESVAEGNVAKLLKRFPLDTTDIAAAAEARADKNGSSARES